MEIERLSTVYVARPLLAVLLLTKNELSGFGWWRFGGAQFWLPLFPARAPGLSIEKYSSTSQSRNGHDTEDRQTIGKN